MVATLTDAKRSAIAEKLADMRAVQNAIIANEQQFIDECKNNEILDRLEDMLEDDQKNLDILETTITQYGIQSEPKGKIKKMVGQAEEMMKSNELSLYEKIAQHELLKHGQVMSGLIVHKAAQIAGSDVEEALAPLNSVNFENRAHQERLKGMLEYLGTKELTGEEPEQGIWGRVQDAVAAMTGAIGSAVTQASDKSDMDITDVIFMDHQKAKTLIGEIKGTNNPQRIQEFFGQLYKDLIVHSKAEEETVYPQIRSFYGDSDTQELYDEQAELETVLNEMKSLEPTASEFKSKLKQVKDMVGDHTRQEESTMFASIKKNLSPEQREQMATQFKEAKKQLQSKM
jgi:hemerythrin superfamily protein